MGPVVLCRSGLGQQGAHYEDTVGIGSGRAVPPSHRSQHTCAEGPGKGPVAPFQTLLGPNSLNSHRVLTWRERSGLIRSVPELVKGRPEIDSSRFLPVAECLFVSGHHCGQAQAGSWGPGHSPSPV